MMTLRIHSLALCTLVALVVSIGGASGVSAQGQPDSIDLRSSVLSPVEYIATNTGIFGHDPIGRGPGLHFPKGSGKSFLFGSGLWFGARKRSRDGQPLVFYTFNVNTGRSEAAPGELMAVDDPAPPYLYHSVDYSPTSGVYLQDSMSLPAWPLWKNLAIDPQSPTMFAPGTYEQRRHQRYLGYDGRTPAFASNADEQMVARYHDGDLKRYEIDSLQAGYAGYPIGLQIEQNVYAWELESLNQNVVVLRYQIINLSGDTLYDCVASQAAEADLGKIDNDHVSFYNARPEQRTGYFWSDPEYDTESRSLAMVLVEAPVVGYDGLVDNSRRAEFRHSGRVGSFPRWTADLMHDPFTGMERYRLMTEEVFATEQGPGDYRGLLSSTRFTMRPGDTAHIAVAFAIVGGIPEEIAIGGDANLVCREYEQEIDRVVAGIMESYYAPAAVTSAPQESHGAMKGDMVMMPNPAREVTTIEYEVSVPGVVRTRISNSIGEVLLAGTQIVDRPGRYREQLDISILPSGFYVVTMIVHGETRSRQLIVE